MKETWRWFGEFDPISLEQIAQTGAQGIVSSLHAIPYGEVWSPEKVSAHRAKIERAGFSWDVVESLPIHEDIKRGQGDLDALFANYRQSLANIAAEGVRTICYNFMPILDWTRTDLASPLARGGTSLRFCAPKMAAFEIHMLGREAAKDLYSQEAIKAGDFWFQQASERERERLLYAIMAGLPGAVSRYDIDGLRDVLSTYDGLDAEDIRRNLARFLQEVVPTASELGLNLCIHPDDPPFPILGLPRVVSTKSDIEWILDVVDEKSNGLTLCTGSLGSHEKNDVIDIANAFGDRVHFAHLRNVRKDADGSFEESAHLEGDVNLVAVIDELLEVEAKGEINIPFRADHGHDLLWDAEFEHQPGYGLIGRMRGLAELRGILATL